MRGDEAPASETDPQGVGATQHGAIRQIERLQQDGLLLLAHLAENPDRGLTTAGQSDDAQIDAGLFTVPAAAIAADPPKLNALLRAVDRLGRSAAPATVGSIRLTSAYLFGASARVAPDELGPARNLRRWMIAVRLMLLVGVSVSVALLMHVDDGRRIVGQLAGVRTELDKTYGTIAGLDKPTDFAPKLFFGRDGVASPAAPALSAMDPCWPVDDSPTGADGKPRTPEYRLVPAKTTAQNLCSQLFQAQLREAMVYARLAAWNCRMTRLNPRTWLGEGVPPYCEQAPADLSPPARQADWKRTELRTNDGIARLTGYILPFLLGGIGGCVAVLRRMEDGVRSWTLNAGDGAAAFGRVILAATFGGLLGLVFGTDGGPVQLGSVSLSLAAWAFFLGYALDSVMRALDSLVASMLGRLRGAEPDKKTVAMTPSP